MACRVGLLAGDFTDVDFFRGVLAGDDEEVEEEVKEGLDETALRERLTPIVGTGMRYGEAIDERGFYILRANIERQHR